MRRSDKVIFKRHQDLQGTGVVFCSRSVSLNGDLLTELIVNSFLTLSDRVSLPVRGCSAMDVQGQKDG